jgi:hypothetical protein
MLKSLQLVKICLVFMVQLVKICLVFMVQLVKICLSVYGVVG